jgi:hypothetical protein
MQRFKIFKYLDWGFKVILVVCFFLAIWQNYFTDDGTVRVFGFSLTQFYPHIEVRIFPLLWVSFFLIPKTKKLLNIEGDFYFSQFLLSALLAVDAFTHSNGFYSSHYDIPFYHRVWFDKIMHFAEGVVLIISLQPIILKFASTVKAFKRPTAWANWMIVGFISIFFIAWEILELFIDSIYGSKLISGPTDTNEDLAFAYIGFLVGFAIIRIGKLIRRSALNS